MLISDAAGGKANLQTRWARPEAGQMADVEPCRAAGGTLRRCALNPSVPAQSLAGRRMKTNDKPRPFAKHLHRLKEEPRRRSSSLAGR